MFCPRCNTELSDSASICSRCGSPVSTGPTTSSPSERPQASTFSYLPAGAPQWPTTATLNFPYGADPMNAQAVYEPDDSLYELESGRPARKPGSLSLPAIILLLILSVLVGSGITYGALALQRGTSGSQQPLHIIPLTPAAAVTPSAGTTPGATPTTPTTVLPTPASFQPISNTDVGVSTRYPSDWTADAPQKSSTSALISVHPTQRNGIAISFERYSQSTSATFKSTTDVNQVNFTQFQSIQGISNFQVISSPTPQQTIGGVAWDEQDATFSNSNNVVFHLTTFAAQYKQIYYDIVYFAPDNVFSQAVQKYFQPMLASFKFLS
jgi:zinc-ribbon domain